MLAVATWGLLGAVGASVGCTSDLVRQRAASEFPCQESQIVVRQLGAGGYEARGCGQRAVFVCARTGGGTTCLRQSGESDPIPPALDRAVGVVPRTEATREFVRIHGAHMKQCVGETTVSVEFTEGGRFDGIQPWPDETPTARTCLGSALAGASLSPAPDGPLTVRFDFTGHPHPDPQPSSPSEAP